MRGDVLITQLKRKFRVSTDLALSKHLGISHPAIQLWKNRRSVTPLQVANLVHKSSFRSNGIRPVVEFFKISKGSSPQDAAFKVFSSVENGEIHPYREGVQKELEKYHGVYIFFDSRGQAIYAGKARRQRLWKELNLAFNRDRGEVQGMRKVSHPVRRQPYRTTEEKRRKIMKRPVPLHEIATYFSAYRVVDSMINDLEALLVRSFANDLLNVRMENFDN